MLLTADLQRLSQNSCYSSWSFSQQSLNVHGSCWTHWSMRHRVFSLYSTDSGVAACISEKAKALSRPECRGAWRGTNESSAQPWLDPAWQLGAWQPPAKLLSTTRSRCHLVPPSTTVLPSHPALLAIYRHTSPPAFAGEIQVSLGCRAAPCRCNACNAAWPCPSEQDEICAVPSLALPYTSWTKQHLLSVPLFDKCFMRVIFSKLFFYSNMHFYHSFLMRNSNHFRSVNWTILTEDAGGKQIVLEPQGKLWHGAVMCFAESHFQNWK